MSRLTTTLRTTVALAATTVLLVSGQQVSTAVTTIAKVENVAITSATQSSMTIRWPGVTGAESYVVERATDFDMASRTTVLETQARRLTIPQLRQGGLYCFQVRAVQGGRMGPRSSKVCQHTVGNEGDESGQVYRAVTYNLCSVKCPGWASRRDDAAALVAATRPDVVMLTEAAPDSGMAQAIGQGMVQVQAKSGKALLYRRDRFTLASAGRENRTGYIDLGLSETGAGHRYGVWAELIERTSGQHVLFVGA